MTLALDQARKFLAKVIPWPQEGDEPSFLNIHTTFQKAGYEKPGWGGRACRSLDEAVNAIEWLTNQPETRDCYFCTSTQKNANPKSGKNNYQYFTPIRNQANAVKLKAIFLDVDCKGGENGYPDLKAAVAAIHKFIVDAALPKPSAVVRSGGGVHVYWTVMRALTPDEWKPLAFALAEAAKRHGLKADTQCTVDSARILRVPGTLNRKTDPAREVRLVGVADFDYANEKIEAALAPYKVAPAKVEHEFLENPELFKPRAPLQGSALAAGVDMTSAAPIDLTTVLPKCGFLNEAVTTGGKDFTNPLWHLTTTIASFCDDGRKQAHRMACGHPGYTKESTDELFDRVEREKANKNFGWPSCAKISACGSKHCQTCPLFVQNKSPLNFAQRVPQARSVISPAPMVLPPNYIQQADGKILRAIPTPEGGTNMVSVCDYPMTDPWLQRQPEWLLHFSTITDSGANRQVTIAFEDIGSEKMRKILQRQGLMLHHYQSKPTSEFIVSWVQTLQKAKAITSAAPFGWHTSDGKLEGFVFAGRCFTPNGERPAGYPDPMIANHYSPTGDAAPWRDAAKMITDQKRPALDAILAAAFGAALVRFTGHSGLMMSVYSPESGIGKSTAMKTAQAVWGDPVRAMQGLNDTPYSVLRKISEIKSLPLYWDELKTEDDTKKFSNLVFQMSSGKDRSRLRNDASLRDTGSWQTLLVSASNDSLVNFVVGHAKMTTAGLYRVFEYTVKPGTIGQIETSDAQRLLAKLHDNYGHIGLEYAKFLGTQFMKIDQDVAACLKDIGKEADASSDERFWVGLIACLLMGARYANQLGFTAIDEKALHGFLLDVLSEMRGERSRQPVDMKTALNVSNILSQYLTAIRRRHTLFTDRIHKGRGKPAKNSVTIDARTDQPALDGIYVQIGTRDKLLRMNSAHFSDWLKEKGYSAHIFRKALVDQYGVKEVAGHLGAGTSLAGTAKEYLLEVPLAGTDLADQFEID